MLTTSAIALVFISVVALCFLFYVVLFLEDGEAPISLLVLSLFLLAAALIASGTLTYKLYHVPSCHTVESTR